jgi:hypothetical protein
MKWVLRGALVLALLAWTSAVWASDEISREIEKQTSDVGFVVVGAAHGYANASRAAHRASRDLGVKLDLRGLEYFHEHGLAWPADSSYDLSGFEFPSYWPRGHQDAGSYVSIEQSDAYSRLRPGYFVVIAASGDPHSAEFLRLFAHARRVYPDAYAFEEPVYQGCVH